MLGDYTIMETGSHPPLVLECTGDYKSNPSLKQSILSMSVSNSGDVSTNYAIKTLGPIRRAMSLHILGLNKFE